MKRVERNKRLKKYCVKNFDRLQQLQQTRYYINNNNLANITTTTTQQILQQTTQQILQRATTQILHQNTKLNPDLELISQQFTNLDQWLNTNLNQWLNTNLNQLVSSIIENHRLRSEKPKSTQTPSYNYRTTTTR
jgi:uncharacterized FlaG/YvyC family protein